MDGILIDSEPYWKQAEVEVFGSVGVPITLEMCGETTGMRMDAAVDHWFRRYPWETLSKVDVAQRVKVRVGDLVRDHGAPIKGAIELVRSLSTTGIKLAVCSSSPTFLIESTCDRLGIRSLFAVLQSAEDCLHGKPHPEPYQVTAERLGEDPEECVVIEDSVTGMTSASAAGMRVIGMPCATQIARAAKMCAIVCSDLTQISAQQILALTRGIPGN